MESKALGCRVRLFSGLSVCFGAADGGMMMMMLMRSALPPADVFASGHPARPCLNSHGPLGVRYSTHCPRSVTADSF